MGYLLPFSFSWAQNQQLKSLEDTLITQVKSTEESKKFVFGGSFGFATGEEGNIDISPEIAYRILPSWQVGIGLSLQRKVNQDENVSYQYGGRLLSRWHPKEKFPFMHVEYNLSFSEDDIVDSEKSKSMLGIGYPIPLGKGKLINLLALKDLGNTPFSINEGWMLRAGILSPINFNTASRKTFSFQKDTTNFSEKPFRERITLSGNMDISMPTQMGNNEAGSSSGNLALPLDTTQLASGDISLSISPSIMYEALRGFYIGTGPSIRYTRQQEQEVSNLDLGVRGFLRYKSFPILPYLQVEYAGTQANSDSTRKTWQNGLLLGGGYNLKLGEMGGVDISLMRQLNHQNNAIQSTPWALRVGISTKLSKGFSGGMPSMKELPSLLIEPLKKVLGEVNFEGNVSVSPGSPTKVAMEPIFNIPIDSMFSVGIGAHYRFEQEIADLDNRENEQFGGNFYFRYLPKSFLPYGQVEYQITNIGGNLVMSDTSTIGEKWEQSLLLGMGYKLKVSKKLSVGITVLRNLTYDGVNPVHNSPWVVRTSISSKLVKPKTKSRSGRQMPKKEEVTKYLIGDILRMEGTTSISFGNPVVVDISPQFTYGPKNKHKKEWWTIGVGPVLHYQNDRNRDISQTIYGARATGRLLLGKGYPFAQLELESLKGQARENLPRAWHNALLLGGGVNFPIGKKSTLNLAALYDTAWQRGNSLRNEPWVVRVGLGI